MPMPAWIAAAARRALERLMNVLPNPALTLIPANVDPVAFLALGIGAAVLVGVAKAGFGGAIGLLATPTMVLACAGDPDSAKLATAILLPVLIFVDQFALLSWWRRWDWSVVALLLPGAVVGIAAGAGAFAALEHLEKTRTKDYADAWLTLAIGVIAVAFVAIQLIRHLRRKPMPFRPVLWQGTAFGMAAGFTSTLTHGAGPITAMYLLPQDQPKETYAASTVMYFWINNLLKLPVYILLGRFSADSAGASLLFLPAAAAGTAFGVLLCRRLGQKQFNIVVYVLLSLAGVKLIHQSLAVLIGG